MSYLILECGSVARGDTNMRSDRDLVCIWSDSPPNYLAIEEAYGDTMFYSLESIKKMREKGSLFLTHLDIDSKYLAGDINIFSFLKGYRPLKKQINNSCFDTLNFIKNINWYPDSLIGRLWLCDVLYVSLRNFIFCKNALKNHYSFGYEDAMRNFTLAENNILTMLLIREGKYSYRCKDTRQKEKINIRDIEEACQVILGQPVKFLAGGTTNWTEIYKKDYWSERLIERAIINKEYDDTAFLNKIKLHNYNKNSIKSDLAKIIKLKNPHALIK